MNQILITEKLYITPELKRKKKIYKFSFFICIILIITLFSVYVYAQYDRDKNEEISQDILKSMEEDKTTISKDNEVWVIGLETKSEDVMKNNSNKSIVTTQSKKSDKVVVNGVVYGTVGSISIPSINVNYPILSETSESLLKVSVCKFWGSNPNEVGNLCIAGHNYRNEKFFSKVPDLLVGDIIEITDLSNNIVRYKIYDKYTVVPEDVSCTSQLTNGKKIVTLITCTDDSKERVIVKAEAME